MNKNKSKTRVLLLAVLSLVLLISVGACLLTDALGNNGSPLQETPGTDPADVVGSEVYDLSLYEESSEEYVAALAQMDEDWFPRKAVVIPKGLEGGDYPNAPAPIYDAFPSQQRDTEDGESYEITRTWIGDIAVGTEVVLKGVVEQGEWCFVTGDTIGGWSSSGWVWCYRLFIPEGPDH